MFLSLLMPIRANGLPSSLFTSDRSCGYMPRQGGHQSAVTIAIKPVRLSIGQLSQRTAADTPDQLAMVTYVKRRVQ